MPALERGDITGGNVLWSVPPAVWSMCSNSPAAASPGPEERLRSGAGFPGSALRYQLKLFSVVTLNNNATLLNVLILQPVSTVGSL